MAETDPRYSPVAEVPSDSDNGNSMQKGLIPRISLDLRQHKTPIAITAVLLITFAGWLPVALYFILRYAANTSIEIAVTVSSVIFGAYSIVPLCLRTWKLVKKNSTCRPIGGTKRHLDYFQMNFISLFCILTAMIAAGSALGGSKTVSTRILAVRIVAMSVSIIMISTCLQCAIIFTATSLNPLITYPFRISSMAQGDIVRPAIYTIVEDIVAVDGNRGTEYRIQLSERYQFSEHIRALFKWADAVWGFSGVLLGAVIIVVIWVVHDERIGYVVGWVVPWIWASALTFLTIKKTQATLIKENQAHFRQ